MQVVDPLLANFNNIMHQVNLNRTKNEYMNI